MLGSEPPLFRRCKACLAYYPVGVQIPGEPCESVRTRVTQQRQLLLGPLDLGNEVFRLAHVHEVGAEMQHKRSLDVAPMYAVTILAPGIHAGGAAETLPACLDCQHVFADAQFARHDTHDLLVAAMGIRSEEHTSELQSRENLVCRLLLEKKKKKKESKYQNTRR